MIKRGLLIFAMTVSLAIPVKAEELQSMRFTCYCPESCPGTITYSGQKVRYGILSSNKDHLGDCAIIYLEDGTFLGYFESLDIGGSKGLKNGTQVDIWTPNLDKAKELMAQTGGKVKVKWIKGVKG